MMNGMTLPPSPMQALQAEHERLLGRLDDAGGAPCPELTPQLSEKLSVETQALIHEARAYIDRCRTESEWISDARDRSQLRANLRFWASFLLNCTGEYPDTALRPARPFVPDLAGLLNTPTGTSGGVESFAIAEYEANAAMYADQGAPDEEEDDQDGNASEDKDEILSAEPTWLGRSSRFLGLFAILIVGVIPLLAVCLALSLFYNLDNQSPWTYPGNAATQTASVRLPLLSVTPVSLGTNKPSATPSRQPVTQIAELPRLISDVSFGEPSPEGESCTPVFVFSLDAPKQVRGKPVPAGNIAIYRAGEDDAIASGNLMPGAAPLSVRLEEAGAFHANPDWLVQVDHPWLGVESVIFSGALFEDCGRSQVSIVYRSQTGDEIWQQALDSVQPGDLNLNWILLTWGPDALERESWVAVVKLIASGGNDSYVYFGRGDLTVPTTAGTVDGVLLGDQVVLGQEYCVPVIAQVGVTSAGQSISRALAVRMVLPECQ